MGIAEVLVIICLAAPGPEACDLDTALQVRHYPVQTCADAPQLEALQVLMFDMQVGYDRNDLLIGTMCLDGGV